jgi:single-strand DNA-binding protein
MAPGGGLGRKVRDFAATLKKGAHVQIEGPLRSREYQKDGATHRVFECKAESILKFDRAERQDAYSSSGADDASEDVPL